MLAPVLLTLGLFAVSGGALIAALVMSRRERLRLEHRLDIASATLAGPAHKPELVRRIDNVGFDMRLRRAFTVGGRHPIWGMKSSGVRLLVIAVAAAAFTFVLIAGGFGWSPWLAIVLALAAAFFLPRAVLLHQQKQAEQAFNELFPDAVIAIARMLRAGLPITTAVRSLSQEASPPVSTVFTNIADQVEIGTPIEDALDASSREIGLADFRFFAMATVLQHLTGGNLATTLEILADIVRRRRSVRLKARATTAEIRISAYVLGALPFLVVGALMLIQPGYLTPLVHDPRGQIILALAAGFLLAAFLTMRQMMRSVTAT